MNSHQVNGITKAPKKKKFKTIVLLLLLVIFCVGILLNPISIALFKLHVMNDGIVKLYESNSERFYISKVKDDKKPIIDFMKSHGGWEFTDQMGLNHHFKSDGKDIGVMRDHVYRYYIWGILKSDKISD